MDSLKILTSTNNKVKCCKYRIVLTVIEQTGDIGAKVPLVCIK